MSKKKSEFPPGWDEERVREILDYYDEQTEEEAIAEYEAALAGTTMEVPQDLVPAIRELIARHRRERDRKSSR